MYLENYPSRNWPTLFTDEPYFGLGGAQFSTSMSGLLLCMIDVVLNGAGDPIRQGGIGVKSGQFSG